LGSVATNANWAMGRGKVPTFQGQNFAKIRPWSSTLKRSRTARAARLRNWRSLGCSKQCKDVVPIPGTSSVERLEENVAAVGVSLSPTELQRIESLAPKGIAVGERYAPAMLELVNR
jgi:aryl-alcohol dehydrogenase-like predicted oxidoreductase